jgi:hypothetical protein
MPRAGQVRPLTDAPLAFRYGARGFVQHGTDTLLVLITGE